MLRAEAAGVKPLGICSARARAVRQRVSLCPHVITCAAHPFAPVAACKTSRPSGSVFGERQRLYTALVYW